MYHSDILRVMAYLAHTVVSVHARRSKLSAQRYFMCLRWLRFRVFVVLLASLWVPRGSITLTLMLGVAWYLRVAIADHKDGAWCVGVPAATWGESRAIIRLVAVRG